MLVRDFMVKKEDVVTCHDVDMISEVIDIVMKHGISAVLILNRDGKPKGIVTKTDLVKAYQNQIVLDTKIAFIMEKDIKTVVDTMTRDDAAKAFENHNKHHAVVVNADGEYVGFISSIDIASEVAKDSRAWPWNRTPDGKFTKPAMTTAH